MTKQKPLDISRTHKKNEISLDLPLARFVLRHKNTPIYYSKYGKLKNFSAFQNPAYSGRHHLPVLAKKSVDSIWVINRELSKKKIKFIRQHRFDVFNEVKLRYQFQKNYWKDILSGSVDWITPARMWNLSLVSAMIFGMFLMTFIYRYLGQSAAAESNRVKQNAEESAGMFIQDKAVAYEDSGFELAIDLIERDKNKKDEEFEKDIRDMVKGYPIEKMVKDIVKKDRIIAAFLVSIAKKESDWGKHVPVLKGEDCFNYWGYKGKRKRMGTGGHTCFDSRKDAIDTVAKRLSTLVYKEKVNTPQKMVTVWKCGYDCSWDDPRNVVKWANDVDKYFRRLNRAD
jgi:hypothetical protein